jgi:hypothetical protein
MHRVYELLRWKSAKKLARLAHHEISRMRSKLRASLAVYRISVNFGTRVLGNFTRRHTSCHAGTAVP